MEVRGKKTERKRERETREDENRGEEGKDTGNIVNDDDDDDVDVDGETKVGPSLGSWSFPPKASERRGFALISQSCGEGSAPYRDRVPLGVS